VVGLVMLAGCGQLAEVRRPDRRWRSLRLRLVQWTIATSLCSFSSKHRLGTTEASGECRRWLAEVVGRVDAGGVGREYTQALLPTRDDSDGSPVCQKGARFSKCAHNRLTQTDGHTGAGEGCDVPPVYPVLKRSLTDVLLLIVCCGRGLGA